jgi:hypothetical protein
MYMLCGIPYFYCVSNEVRAIFAYFNLFLVIYMGASVLYNVLIIVLAHLLNTF